MVVASLTRLRLRSLRFLPGFAWYAVQSRRSMRRTPGFLRGSLLADRHLAFWTLSLWSDETALKRWRSAGAHGRSMPKLKHWCDEAGVARWELPNDAALPGWQACHRELVSRGRLTPVLHPSPVQVEGVAAVPAPTTRPSFAPI